MPLDIRVIKPGYANPTPTTCERCGAIMIGEWHGMRVCDVCQTDEEKAEFTKRAAELGGGSSRAESGS